MNLLSIRPQVTKELTSQSTPLSHCETGRWAGCSSGDGPSVNDSGFYKNTGYTDRVLWICTRLLFLYDRMCVSVHWNWTTEENWTWNVRTECGCVERWIFNEDYIRVVWVIIYYQKIVFAFPLRWNRSIATFCHGSVGMSAISICSLACL